VRVYLPATIGMLRKLVSDGKLQPLGGTGFALTPALRESYVSGSTEELEYAALLDAARASLRLLADDEKELPRRVVISVDVESVTLRSDLDAPVVKLSGPILMDEVAAVHVDAEDADLGDPDAEFALGDAEDHELAWYAPQELPFLLELL
jgi:hypothetical protein